MKKIFTLLATVFLALHLFAQAPSQISYQAIIRDASSQLIADQEIGMKVSILQASTTGNAVYEETQNPTSNSNGLITIEIGSGTVVSGNFSTIDWAAGTFFLRTEVDPTGGTNYTVSGTSQLLSVPYALYAKEAGNTFSGSFDDLSDIPENLSKKYAVGDQLQGGIVFYVDESGQHGLICAKVDQATNIGWHFGEDSLTGAHSQGIGGGYINTMLIIAALKGDYGTSYAAKACASYFTNDAGITYGNWYLPNIYELRLVQENKEIINATARLMGGQALSEEYWTSREGGPVTDAYAYTVFMSGASTSRSKISLKAVRAIKAF